MKELTGIDYPEGFPSELKADSLESKPLTEEECWKLTVQKYKWAVRQSHETLKSPEFQSVLTHHATCAFCVRKIANKSACEKCPVFHLCQPTDSMYRTLWCQLKFFEEKSSAIEESSVNDIRDSLKMLLAELENRMTEREHTSSETLSKDLPKGLTRKIFYSGGWWTVEEVLRPNQYDAFLLLSTPRWEEDRHSDGSIPMFYTIIDADNDTFYIDTEEVRSLLKEMDKLNEKKEKIQEKLFWLEGWIEE